MYSMERASAIGASFPPRINTLWELASCPDASTLASNAFRLGYLSHIIIGFGAVMLAHENLAVVEIVGATDRRRHNVIVLRVPQDFKPAATLASAAAALKSSEARFDGKFSAHHNPPKQYPLPWWQAERIRANVKRKATMMYWLMLLSHALACKRQVLSS